MDDGIAKLLLPVLTLPVPCFGMSGGRFGDTATAIGVDVDAVVVAALVVLIVTFSLLLLFLRRRERKNDRLLGDDDDDDNNGDTALTDEVIVVAEGVGVVGGVIVVLNEAQIVPVVIEAGNASREGVVFTES